MISKVVAIVGASGNVGKAFTDKFLTANAFQLRVLVRASSVDSPIYQGYKQRGSKLQLIDFEDETSIVEALNGVDVFISAVAGPAWSAQKNVRKTVWELGLPIAILENAAFSDLVIRPELGWSFAEKKVIIWGDGNTKIGWTTTRSVADWLTHVLKTVPVEQLQDRRFKIQANTYTYNEIVSLWEQKHNDKLEVEHRPLKELEDRFAANPNDVFAALMLELGLGRMNIGGKDNSMYPDWQPGSVESVL